MKYRSEIDGLRFLCIILVIIYHIRLNLFGINIFKGGFVGVDVFFVISGYLITNIIFREIQNNDFTLFGFFERRARRILPILIFVSIFSFCFFSLAFTEEDFSDFSRTIISSLLFISNYLFLLKELEYGADTFGINPFVHTWSLSIEEQFYILFPLIILLFRYKTRIIIPFLTLTFFMSLMFCIKGSNSFPESNFYLFPSRIWEILIGSLIFFIPKSFLKNNLTCQIAPIIGIILILFSASLFNDIDNNFPSYKNLMPTIGAALIIFFCNSKDITSRILSFSIFTFIGKISFSLYLVHVPIIAFFRITEILESNIINKIIVITVIFLISALTYIFIEKPFRNKKLVSTRYFLVTVIASYVLLISLNSSSSFISSKINNIDKYYQDLFESGKKKETFQIQDCIDKDFLESRVKGQIEYTFKCDFGKLSGKKIYLIGDSHMKNLAENFFINNKDYRLKIYITTGCFYLPGYDRRSIWTNNITEENCSNKNMEKLKKILSSDRNSIFIFNFRPQMYIENKYYGRDTSNWDYYYKHENGDIGLDSKKFVQEYNSLLKNNNSIFLIYPTPELSFDVASEIKKLILKEKFLNIDIKERLKNLIEPYNKFYERSLRSINFYDALKHEEVIKIYPSNILCDMGSNSCKTIDENGIYYQDDNHLSMYGSKILMHKINKMINFK